MADSLFDAYDPNTYGPSQGSLIQQLLASGALTQPTTPGPGFPQAPMDANAAAPQPAQPQNAAPIAVGNNYMMPRIGPAAAFTPPAIDPDTGDTVQPAAAPAQQPQQAAAPANPLSNFFNRAAAGLHSVAQGGSLYGAVTGQPDDPTSLQQRQLQREYQAFLGTGVFLRRRKRRSRLSTRKRRRS
jgi:hypothetical protein